jgi:sporulation protein YlmC with PRC-barrel domain
VQLRTGKQLRHGKVEASDGEIGSLHDVYFDDRTWRVRYLVIHTSKWLFGRKVLISPESIVRGEDASDSIRLNLTREQIKNSPSWDTDPPVSKQYEGVLHNYYGWGAATIPPGASIGAPILAGTPYEVVGAPAALDVQEHSHAADYDDHLRSMIEIVGYEITGKNGGIGHIGDFAFEVTAQRVHSLIVFANRIPDGPTIMLSVNTVIAIDWATAQVETTLSRRSALSLPEWSDNRS